MLLEQMQGNAQAATDQALSDYREIVLRNQSPEAADAARLPAIMKVLGLSQADLESDIAAANRHASLSSRVLSDEKIEENIKSARERMVKADFDARESTGQPRSQRPSAALRLFPLECWRLVSAAGELIRRRLSGSVDQT